MPMSVSTIMRRTDVPIEGLRPRILACSQETTTIVVDKEVYYYEKIYTKLFKKTSAPPPRR